MKIIVTHKACDLDAVASSWMIKKFLPGWENAEVRFVPAGEKLAGKYIKKGDIIEQIEFTDGNVADVIHVDTGMDSLDHHQIADDNVCATSLAFEYAVDDDHFQEVFWENPTSTVYDFSIVGLLQGIKLMYPKDDMSVLNFGFDAIDAAYHYIESQIWAEHEIESKGIRFDTKWGKALAIETLNDGVLKLGQEMGYVVTLRKDPETGNVRIKARPKMRSGVKSSLEDVDVDFTPVYEILSKKDPEASWFLHISKRMLLNGSSKNPDMKGSKLSLDEVVEVLQNLN
jgi:hypothetical protein